MSAGEASGTWPMTCSVWGETTSMTASLWGFTNSPPMNSVSKICTGDSWILRVEAMAGYRLTPARRTGRPGEEVVVRGWV